MTHVRPFKLTENGVALMAPTENRRRAMADFISLVSETELQNEIRSSGGYEICLSASDRNRSRAALSPSRPTFFPFFL
ncbi:hypothetical protein L484_027490 [Morus notabilis]|uniref:Uncharacterized protein n=1 Tax=Morus notabilis TaxID=981085 RepID=W9RY28_9ROSA|nr:hypothetical protein L484_027490 [Morus notabilis]